MDTIISNGSVQNEFYLDHFLWPSPEVSDEGQVHTFFFKLLISALHLLQVTTEKRRQCHKNKEKSAAQNHQTP